MALASAFCASVGSTVLAIGAAIGAGSPLAAFRRLAVPSGSKKTETKTQNKAQPVYALRRFTGRSNGACMARMSPNSSNVKTPTPSAVTTPCPTNKTVTAVSGISFSRMLALTTLL